MVKTLKEMIDRLPLIEDVPLGGSLARGGYGLDAVRPMSAWSQYQGLIAFKV
jgi:hypothetical protein